MVRKKSNGFFSLTKIRLPCRKRESYTSMYLIPFRYTIFANIYDEIFSRPNVKKSTIQAFHSQKS